MTTTGTASATGAARTTSPPPLPPAPSIDTADKLVITVTVPDSIDTTGIDIDGAIAAYKNLVRTSDKAGHHPEKKWASELKKYAVDPLLSQSIADIKMFRSNGTHTTGHGHYSGRVVQASPTMATLKMCADSTGLDIVNTEGQSVKAGTGGRAPIPTHLVRKNNGKWFVQSLDVDRSKSC